MDVDSQVLPGCSVEGIQVVELHAGDAPQLQQLFEQAPAYFIAVNGEPALRSGRQRRARAGCG